MPLLLIGAAGLLAGAGLGFGGGVITRDGANKALLLLAVGGSAWFALKFLRAR